MTASVSFTVSSRAFNKDNRKLIASNHDPLEPKRPCNSLAEVIIHHVRLCQHEEHHGNLSVLLAEVVSAHGQALLQPALGLSPKQPGYKPSPADLQAFQIELQEELQKLGF